MDCHPYVNNLEAAFRAQAPQLKSGPLTFRSIRDSWYIFFLFLFLVTFIGVSVYTISQGWTAWHLDSDHTHTLATDKLSIFVGVVLGMAGVSILTCVALILCWRSCAAAAINMTMMGMITSLLLFSMVCFQYGSVAGGVVILVVLMIFLIMLCCCFSKHTDTADFLVEATGHMLRGAGKMVSIPTMVMAIISLVFSSLLTLAYAGITQMVAVGRISEINCYILYVCLGSVYLLLMFVLYYSMSFLMGVAASYWYCQITPPSKTVGLKWLFKYNLGTVSFCSLIILVVKMMQTIVYLLDRHAQTKCLRSMRCISRGLSSSVSGLLHTLNNYGVIVSAYTGYGLIDSSKIASVLVFTGYPFFNVVRVVGNFLFFCSLLFCLCLPTFISILIAQSTASLREMSNIVGMSVFLTSLLTSVVLLSTTIQSLSSVFLLHSLDSKVSEEGGNAFSNQQETKEILNKLSQRFNLMRVITPSSVQIAID